MATNRRKAIDPKAQSLAVEKFKTSGLNLDDAKQLGIDVLTAQQTGKLHSSFKPLISLKLNYFAPDGKPLIDWPQSNPFYRLRYLETPVDFDNLSKKKPVRYVQEPNTAPVAYFPQNFDAWQELCRDTDLPLILTEGELKAAKACKEGFPTIGLGGVYNWKSTRLGVTWLPSLNLVNWSKRNVYVCFDSDYRTNPLVCAALKELADALHNQGSFVHLVSLPQLPGLEKVGLDDFLVHGGAASCQLFEGLLHEAVPLGLTAPLWDLNTQYCYVRNPGLIIDQASFFKSTPGGFKEHLASTAQYQERQLKADGSVSYKQVSASAAWLRWPLRTEAAKLTYAPGEPRFTRSSSPAFNTWPGWGVEPKAGDIVPFEKLLDHLFTGAEPAAKEWFICWCAYPLQYPGSKLFSSAVFHGIRHGTGKSLVGYTLGRIYGQNFTEISQVDLHSSFNEWAESKQFVMGDDVTGSNKRQDADFLKKLITQQELRVNGKYVPTYVVPDCINYFFTANHPDSFFLEDDDRRSFIHEVVVGPLPEEFYVEYSLWLDSGGAAAVFDWLLKVDLGDFNPAAPAFRTHAKMRMISTVQSDLASWVRQLIATPDHLLKLGDMKLGRDLYTSKELLALYDPIGKTGTTANGMARELARAGIRQVCDGLPIRLADGSQGRYYDVRNPHAWSEWTFVVAKNHLDGWNLAEKEREKKRGTKY